MLGALALILLAAAMVLSALVHQLSILGSGPIIPIVVVYAGVGVVVARRQPRNPIGWILIGFIVLFLLSSDVGSYAALYYRFGHHGLPLAPVAVLLAAVVGARPGAVPGGDPAVPGRQAGVAALAMGTGRLRAVRSPGDRRPSTPRRSPPWPTMTSGSTPTAT